MVLTIADIRQETPTTESLIFEKPDSFSYQPGQFMRWTFPVDRCDERCNSRPFSLASSPTEDYLMITTRIGPSALKQTVKNIKKGRQVKAIGPLGKFVLDDSDLPILMLAGGIGITPLRSMIKYIIDKKINRQLTLLYSNKIPAEIVYRHELDKWKSTYPNIKVVYTITKPVGPTDKPGPTSSSSGSWTGKTGRIDEKMIKTHTLDIKNTQFYICGPPKMVEAMEKLVKNLGVSHKQLHVERFAGY